MLKNEETKICPHCLKELDEPYLPFRPTYRPNRFESRGKESVIFVQNREVLVDTEALPMLLRRRWCLINKSTVPYAHSRTSGQNMLMHHIIVGKPERPFVVDHVNNNTLDNRLKNLRIVSISENNLNRRRRQFCSKGHTLSGNNIFHGKTPGSIGCRECRREYHRKRRMEKCL